MSWIGKSLTSGRSRRRAVHAHAMAVDLRHGRKRLVVERNIDSQLAGQLGREIVAGVYPPGSLLPNATETCARSSVSRTALREAYSRLSAKALIIARPKIGTRVRPNADWNLLIRRCWPGTCRRGRPNISSAISSCCGRWSNRPRRLWPRRRLPRHHRPDRRRLRPDGPVQERRGRPHRRGSRFPHGDSRSRPGTLSWRRSAA